jgi:hypothetical protein
MRALAIAAFFVGIGAGTGCKAEVGNDTYFCGVEADCPEGQLCNGPNNRCVNAASAEPFACEQALENEPDNTIAQAFALPHLDCISPLSMQPGCIADHDDGDWYTFAVPEDCTAVVAHIHISYPIAYEELPFEISDVDGTTLEHSTECGPNETSLAALGLVDRCLKRTVTPGMTYGIHIIADPTLSCDGDCAFNRYTLTVSLQTP